MVFVFYIKGGFYQGIPQYDEVELQQEEYARLSFWHWLDPDSQDECEVLFPREAIKDLFFMITI